MLTAFRRDLLQINLKTDVIVGLWRRFDKSTIFPLENVIYAILDKLIPAADVHGKEEASLAFRRGQVEPNAIKVYKLDIKRAGPV